MATVTVTETGVRVRVDLYRNFTGNIAFGTFDNHDPCVKIIAESITDVPSIQGRQLRDVDVTELLTPAQIATVMQMLDLAEAYAKNEWDIP
jgi:hypothetical protein